jgi:N-acetylneuraminic acid mutarotase
MEHWSVGAMEVWFCPRDAQQFLGRYVAMSSKISKLFIVCIISIAIGGVQQVTAAEMEAGTWTRKADMPTARYWSGSAVVDGKIYVFGGMVIGGEPVPKGITAVVEEYDPATDTWTRRADMPTARHGVRAAAVDGIIYAIGGWKGDAVTCWGNMLSTVEAYDPATDTWDTKAGMPTRRGASAIAVVDGRIYVIGGPGKNVANLPLSTVEAYDPATDTWTTKADMPTARRKASACVIDGRIYVSGGATTRGGILPPTVPTVEIYDPATDTWTQTFDMPWGRFDHSASAVDGKIYIVGGLSSEMVKQFGGDEIADNELVTDELKELLAIVHVYDPATDTWTTAADFPGVPMYRHTAAVVDGKIYIIGGGYGPEDVVLSASGWVIGYHVGKN